MSAVIPAGSKVTILRGVNADRKGVVQAGTWPNSHGNYGIDIAQADGKTTGYWISKDDVQLDAPQ